MLDNMIERGFSDSVLSNMNDPRIRKDEIGFYMMSLSENSKVYFNDFYKFLELAYQRAADERQSVDLKTAEVRQDHLETLSYYAARGVIVDQLQVTIRRFYSDNSNFGVIMTPWCFGTVVLEKLEVYRDRIARGDVIDPNVGQYPYFVVKYIDEICKITLLALFDFPDSAFQMRWQYSELLKRYSKILTNITGSLQSVLHMIKNYGS